MEKAATKAKNSGSTNAFAALVKDCGEQNPFSKFLGPIDVQGAPSPRRGQIPYAHHATTLLKNRFERHV